jgi:2-polyprenyl-6-methoxyphenol hydroxylase-like FAD-dependent oxidoreductase
MQHDDEDEHRLKADVVIVGGGIAGCSTAVMLGRMGLEVVVLDAETDMNAHKRSCAHYIQPSAVPMLRKHGLAPLIEEHGGIRSVTDVWMRWGWIRSHLPADQYGYNVRRETLDPMLRRVAAWTPGVRIRQGHAIKEVLRRGDRVSGVIATDQKTRKPLMIEARLVIAADGRWSPTAKLAGISAETRPNSRFAYLAYYENPRKGPEATRQRVWYLEPNVAYESPTDGGLSCFSVLAPKNELGVWRIDPRAAMRRIFAGLPGGIDLADLKKHGPVTGVLEMPNMRREPAIPGLALVGDAALCADPLFRTGCGWAFQSSAWLAETVGPSLKEGSAEDLDAALVDYSTLHTRETLPHYELISGLSTGRPLKFGERMLSSAATRSGEVARLFELLTARSIPPQEMSRAGVVFKVMTASLRRGRSSSPATTAR